MICVVLLEDDFVASLVATGVADSFEDVVGRFPAPDMKGSFRLHCGIILGFFVAE